MILKFEHTKKVLQFSNTEFDDSVKGFKPSRNSNNHRSSFSGMHINHILS